MTAKTTTKIHLKNPWGEAECGAGNCARIDCERGAYDDRRPYGFGALAGTSRESEVTCKSCRNLLKREAIAKTDAYITAYKKYEAAAAAAYDAYKTGNAALIAMTGDACDAASMAFDAIAKAK